MPDASDPSTEEMIRELTALGYEVLPRSRGAGRPAIWIGTKSKVDRLMHVWIGVEIRAYTISKTPEPGRRKAKKLKIQPAVKSLFKLGKPWSVYVGGEDERHDIAREGQVRELYYKAQRLMKKDSELCCDWAHSLEGAKWLIDHNVRIEVTEDRIRIRRGSK